MMKILRLFGFICLGIASIFSLINTIVEKNIFYAWIILSLYLVSCVSLIIWLILNFVLSFIISDVTLVSVILRGLVLMIFNGVVVTLREKIMDLQKPDKKMSKSSETEKGVIRLLDDLNLITSGLTSSDNTFCKVTF